MAPNSLLRFQNLNIVLLLVFNPLIYPCSVFLFLNPVNQKLYVARFFKTPKQLPYTLPYTLYLIPPIYFVCSPLTISIKLIFLQLTLEIHPSNLLCSFITFRYVCCTLDFVVQPINDFLPTLFLLHVIVKIRREN